MGPRSITGVVQHYAWGDERFIPELLGHPVDGRPWAELWLGTHEHGPSMFDDRRPLADATGPLPYLLKVLAAATPLSLQAHPSRQQAERGHATGVFGDPHDKPELLVALTRFEALCGVRPAEATVSLLRNIGVDELAALVDSVGPGEVIRRLCLGRIDPRPIIAACAGSTTVEAAWVRELDRMYPGEPAVAVSLLLNHVTLHPGEALRVSAGNLHAYLGGAGVELMGASDNVVRAGLTVKEVDVGLLLDVLDATPLANPILEPADGRYPLPEAGCALVHIEAGRTHVSTGDELALALDGSTVYLPAGSAWEPAADAYVVVTDG